MKTIFISCSILLLLAVNGAAQNTKSGVYKTLADFNNGNLEYAVDCKSEKHEIKLNEFLNEPFITVKYKDTKIKLKKDSIYAVQTCDGSVMRFQNKEHFNLAEKGGVWVFYKEVSPVNGKIVSPEKKYYFSIRGDGKLLELTADNIKAAFPDDHVLHDMIDAQVKNNQDITAYDSFHKMYKVNHLISASKNGSGCPVHIEERGKEGEKCPKCGVGFVNPKKQGK